MLSGKLTANPEVGKIFANHVFDEESVSQIYETLKIGIRKMKKKKNLGVDRSYKNSPTKKYKWQYHLKRCLILLAIRYMLIKTTREITSHLLEQFW